MPCSNSVYSLVSDPRERKSKELTCSIPWYTTHSNDIGFILFIPGTGVEKALDQYTRLYDLIDLPDVDIGDVQIFSE